ncbi:putative g-patch rna maturation protein [Phaeomoniella chlamydospora]|uniref:Protein PXR1 n=1 Tax=Phaeomoniella chlamydospora TaxID=158046 RepID=A0A0G2HL35_PHACM|nr:putative g-patch rna maturation protein [Phaeomoniella chlamydospora]
MGLAEPRKRIKLSNDPNNLNWSQNTSSFGARILTSQGWSPGEYLGAKNARHASHYSSASQSHIRIKVKDDGLGLGAQSAGKLADQRSKQVDAFQGLLGRLNGKSEEELQKEVRKGNDLRLAMYANGKWGGMQFVRGGVLVQGKDYREGVDEKDIADITEEEELKKKKAKRREEKKKRKAEAQEEVDDNSSSDPAAKKQRKEERRKRKEERRLRKSAGAAASMPSSEPMSGTSTPATPVDTDSLSSEAKKERKRNHKEEKLAKKLAKEQAKKKKREQKPSSSSSSSESGNESEDTPTSGTASPISRPSSTTPGPLPRTGRHFLRGKNIMSKRMAFQDANGLDGIFMKVNRPESS